MSTYREKSELVFGEYKHYKGKLYTVYAVVSDEYENKYILYQQKYGNKDFWIRPYEMFWDDVMLSSGEMKKRFKKTQKHTMDRKKAFDIFLTDVKNRAIYIRHSETEEEYFVFSIVGEPKYEIKVASIDFKRQSGYLTDFQLAYRMGWHLFTCDGEKLINKVLKSLPSEKSFNLIADPDRENDYGSHKLEILKELKNPCSIDLHIARKYFYKTRRKRIDMVSLNHVINASKLWKPVLPKKYHGEEGFLLRPHQTVITHTLEKIKIPSDCAGKIEIKSTYARLSLSVTTADFCNPGWEGYFPLVLRNDGTNSIVLHPGEKMLQMMLIPLGSSIVNEYRDNSTYMGEKKDVQEDDGTPYRFWNARTVEKLRKESGFDEIVSFYNKMCQQYDNIEMKQRFENSFLRFCDKKKYKRKYRTHEDIIKVDYLYDEYIKREKMLYRLSCKSVKIPSMILTLLGMVIGAFAWIIPNPASSFLKKCMPFFIVVLVGTMILWVLSLYLEHKTFCITKCEMDDV